MFRGSCLCGSVRYETPGPVSQLFCRDTFLWRAIAPVCWGAPGVMRSRRPAAEARIPW